MNRGVRLYAVQTRTIGGVLHTVAVEAEDSFMAHRAVKGLFPERHVVRISLVPECKDGEDW